MKNDETTFGFVGNDFKVKDLGGNDLVENISENADGRKATVPVDVAYDGTVTVDKGQIVKYQHPTADSATISDLNLSNYSSHEIINQTGLATDKITSAVFLTDKLQITGHKQGTASVAIWDNNNKAAIFNVGVTLNNSDTHRVEVTNSPLLNSNEVEKIEFNQSDMIVTFLEAIDDDVTSLTLVELNGNTISSLTTADFAVVTSDSALVAQNKSQLKISMSKISSYNFSNNIIVINGVTFNAGTQIKIIGHKPE